MSPNELARQEEGFITISEPAILIGEMGEIHAWYLPEAISYNNQVQFTADELFHHLIPA